MIHTTLLLLHRDATSALADTLAAVQRTLESLGRPYEIIIVDDGSGPAAQQSLRNLAAQSAALRVLQLAEPMGVSAAISAGLAAAAGQVIVATTADSGFPAEQLPRLIDRLAGADMVYGRRRLNWAEKMWHRLVRLPRWLLLGLDVHHPDTVFWAARSEALAGVELARGMYRYLATLVTMRGYRVAEVYIEGAKAGGRQLADAWPNPLDLLCAWWLKRRWQLPAVKQWTAEAMELKVLCASTNNSRGDQSPGPSARRSA